MFKVSVALPKRISDRPYWIDCCNWARINGIAIKFQPDSSAWFTCEEHAMLFRLKFNV